MQRYLFCKKTWILKKNLTLIFLLLLNIKASVASFEKYTEAFGLAKSTNHAFVLMFQECLKSAMPTLHFEIDDVKRFVNYPSKTTVGFAPKFTSNRKFFANLISTTAFKDMIDRDREKLEKSFVSKMKYCDASVMDRSMIREFYDRETDQNKAL